jgi:hypothetical protein
MTRTLLYFLPGVINIYKGTNRTFPSFTNSYAFFPISGFVFIRSKIITIQETTFVVFSCDLSSWVWSAIFAGISGRILPQTKALQCYCHFKNSGSGWIIKTAYPRGHTQWPSQMTSFNFWPYEVNAQWLWVSKV